MHLRAFRCKKVGVISSSIQTVGTSEAIVCGVRRGLSISSEILYCRYRNRTGSAPERSRTVTAGRESHPALKINMQLHIVYLPEIPLSTLFFLFVLRYNLRTGKTVHGAFRIAACHIPADDLPIRYQQGGKPFRACVIVVFNFVHIAGDGLSGKTAQIIAL